uniref:Uncharacterized protein n=1 Tax=Nelumbo nucifera TaxID=4432 RepID=A0A822XTK2_NELNU|nr:TPA_asm: hypothetical protein HUJ06_023892 [Nelumbo nucifera]
MLDRTSFLKNQMKHQRDKIHKFACWYHQHFCMLTNFISACWYYQHLYQHAENGKSNFKVYKIGV